MTALLATAAMRWAGMAGATKARGSSRIGRRQRVSCVERTDGAGRRAKQAPAPGRAPKKPAYPTRSRTARRPQGPQQIFEKADGGGGWIRTNVGVRQRIYSPSPLATRAPLRWRRGLTPSWHCCQRGIRAGRPCCRRRRGKAIPVWHETSLFLPLGIPRCWWRSTPPRRSRSRPRCDPPGRFASTRRLRRDSAPHRPARPR